MNPLELVVKTLHSWDEKDLSEKILDAFGQRAQTFQQFDDVAKCFFELKFFESAIFYGKKGLNLAKTKEEIYLHKRNKTS